MPGPELILRDKTALVTGASAGIGREIARLLAREVAGLVLVARRQERLEELAAELRAERPELHVRARAVDLADREAVLRLLDALELDERRVDVLVNNAGVGDYGLFEREEWPRLEAMLELNVVSSTLLLHRLVPKMVERGSGAVLNVGSVAGFFAQPGGAAYGASKAYLNHLSEALRAELAGTGVTVTTVCPGPVETEFFEAARSDRRGDAAPPRALYVDVEACAAQAVAALKAGRPRVVPGALMRAVGVALESIPQVVKRPFLVREAKKVRRG